MSRTYRKDIDGTKVHDGKAYNAANERSDPWDWPQPYDRAEARKLLETEIIQYLIESEERETSDILEYIFTKHPELNTLGGSWLILTMLDDMKERGLIT